MAQHRGPSCQVFRRRASVLLVVVGGLVGLAVLRMTSLTILATGHAFTGVSSTVRTRGRRFNDAALRHIKLHAALADDNHALVFVKPHANTPATLALVPRVLAEKSIEVLRMGSLQAQEIDDRGIIDTHYAAIARVGMARDIASLGLGDAESHKFMTGYGKPLADAIAAKEVYSGVTAQKELGVSPTELLDRCLAAGYEKLRSGLYCARLTGADDKTLYVLNGFYPRMREKFVAPGVVVHWFAVRFSASELPWASFRSQVIGSTNPPDAAHGSLRAQIRDGWQELGMSEPTNYQDNGIHASAGPLEALRERVIWLGDDPKRDQFGEALAQRRGVEFVTAMIENPDVEYDEKQSSVFDLLEDVDSREALEVLSGCKMLEG